MSQTHCDKILDTFYSQLSKPQHEAKSGKTKTVSTLQKLDDSDILVIIQSETFLVKTKISIQLLLKLIHYNQVRADCKFKFFLLGSGCSSLKKCKA